MFLHHPGANWFCKSCEYNNTWSLMQMKVYFSWKLYHTLICFSYRKKWMFYEWNERCFHLRNFPMFSWIEVTYKKVIRYPESPIFFAAAKKLTLKTYLMNRPCPVLEFSLMRCHFWRNWRLNPSKINVNNSWVHQNEKIIYFLQNFLW